MFRRAGDVMIYREGEGASGGGGGGGGDGAPAIPWASGDTAKPWAIGDKPWYEVGITGDDDIARGTRDFLKAKNYRDPAVVARSLYELNRSNEHLKANAITLPGENATPEETAAFYKKMGRPDSVEGYKEVKWGDNADAKMVEFGAKMAFELGLPPKAAEKMAATWNAFMAEQATAAEQASAQANEQAVGKLREAWGPEYDQYLTQGRRVMDALRANGISEEDFQAVEQHIGVAPLVKLLGTIGKMTGEAGFMGTTGGGVNAEIEAMTPEAAKTAIETKMADKDFSAKYHDKNHPEHKTALVYMEQLFKKAGNLM